MTKEEIEALSEDEVLSVMRREGIEVSHSLYASIRDTPEEMDAISETLANSDLLRWRGELTAHFAGKS